jgi:hypothetical protein
MSNGPEGEKNSPLKPGAGSPHILPYSSLSLFSLVSSLSREFREEDPHVDEDGLSGSSKGIIIWMHVKT